ncbi:MULTISPECIES: GNAT family N-acetyltransferase [unclassified Synechococcus]|uniref:GNAT family N-acetyltransferase n=1 Tax=unclassified Synechococcus TaxID=2626047 RepID=UPI0021A4359C|nr:MULTISPECIES: GNAT family N-acetyltransferase [unclassified Synechococcus]MCT0213514.1 hypothetical protein [Synechococcus sp. CS-1326]MCT0234671.1 hypothetical protein [Synechococcus sp. CS-1327]
MTEPAISRRLMAHGFAQLGRRGGSWHTEGDAGWFAAPIPHPFANCVISAGTAWTAASLARLDAFFRRGGRPCIWLCWPDQRPAEQGRQLLELGYQRLSPAALMNSATAPLLAATANPGQRVAMAVPGAELLPLGPAFAQAYGRCAALSFAAPAAMGQLAAETLLGDGSAESPLTYGVVLGSELLAVATSLVLDGTGSILWVGTLPAWRSMGLGRAVTAAAIAAGAARGARLTLLQASAGAESLYAAMGFGRAGVLELYLRPAG